MMQIIPAIDIRGGKCVRLRQGDYSQETVFATDPADIARRWVSEGAQFLHIVDLDGARESRPVNVSSIRAIVESCGVPCQLGGGLRTEDDVAAALSWGILRVVIGTKALESPDWLSDITQRFPGKIVLGVDAKEGRVATHGWLDVSDQSAVEFVQSLSHLPLGGLVYTDISRDGMLQGVNIPALAEMCAATKLPVIASGGVTTIEDVRRLAELPLAGCIVGRALYEGHIILKDILNVCATNPTR